MVWKILFYSSDNDNKDNIIWGGDLLWIYHLNKEVYL